jgi:protein TonB
MPEGGFFEQKRSSPTSLVVVVAVHAAAIAALALAKMEMPQIDLPKPLTVRNIPITPDPPPIPPEPVKDRAEPPKSVLTMPSREIRTPVTTDLRAPVTEPTDTALYDPYVGQADKPRLEPLPPPPPPQPMPVPAPVRVEAKLRPGIELLPPYPPAEERAEAEGSVTIKLLIGPDGRVKAAEKVRAASEAFWRATERHALRAWRFTPATVDGKPVESSKVMTVHFELRG